MVFLDLFRPKWKHSDWRVRIEAIKKVTSQEILVDIAKSDKKPKVRIAAIEKVTDQNVLVDIAKSDKKPKVCLAAIEKVTDQKAVRELEPILNKIIGLEDASYRTQGHATSSPVQPKKDKGYKRYLRK